MVLVENFFISENEACIFEIVSLKFEQFKSVQSFPITFFWIGWEFCTPFWRVDIWSQTSHFGRLTFWSQASHIWWKGQIRRVKRSWPFVAVRKQKKIFVSQLVLKRLYLLNFGFLLKRKKIRVRSSLIFCWKEEWKFETSLISRNVWMMAICMILPFSFQIAGKLFFK